MTNNKNSDTITAVSTPSGIGGIAVVRISGNDAITITDKCLRTQDRLANAETHTAHHSWFRNSRGDTVDEVIAVVYRNPRSYTGEDTVEISCHGGTYVARKILDSLVENGARIAEPGEFTKRAFLNGKMDLAQAEAVADVISANSDRALRGSIRQLEGRLSEKIKSLQNKMVDILSLLELELDFAEDGYEFADKEKVETLIHNSIFDINHLIETYSYGRVLRDGAKIVITGPPNVGKSSLLNTLLGDRRAIVTHIPGTTRDTIEESVIIDGVLMRLVDTAGLRETEDIIEKEGMERARKEFEDADIVLCLFDASEPTSKEDILLAKTIIDEIRENGGSTICVLNKMDLARNNHTIMPPITEKVVRISALLETGIEELKKRIVEGLTSTHKIGEDESVIITNARHRSALLKSKNNLELALMSVKNKMSSEFIAFDMRTGLNNLGEIIGTVTTDEILDSIFTKFCIGK